MELKEKIELVKKVLENITLLKKEGIYNNDVKFSDDLLSVEMYIRLLTLLEHRLVTIEELIKYIDMSEAVAHRELKMLENISESAIVLLDKEEVDLRLKDISKLYNKTFIERAEEKIDSGVALGKEKLQEYKPHLEKGITVLEKGTEKMFSVIKNKLK